MADYKKKKDTARPPFDFGAEKNRLVKDGPDRLYILRGEEEYLRDSFLALLRDACVEEGAEAFNLHRLSGASPDMGELAACVEAVPFMGERTFTEVRGFDINRIRDSGLDDLKRILSDIPEWATVAFVFSPEYAMDGRLGAVKLLKKTAHDIEFYTPPQAELQKWVVRESKKLGKEIGAAAANHLIWVCGYRMNAMLSELTKAADYADGAEVTEADIDAVAEKVPETTIFDLTDALGARRFDQAAGLLADMLADKNEPPQKQIAMISEQYRRLYVTAVAMEQRKGDDYILSCIPELSGRRFLVDRLKKTAGSYGAARLGRAVVMCAECDFGMRSGGPAPEALMKELILHLAMDR